MQIRRIFLFVVFLCQLQAQDRKALLVGGLADVVVVDLETKAISGTLDFGETVSSGGMGAIVDANNSKVYLHSFVADTQQYSSLVRLNMQTLEIEQRMFLPEYADSFPQGFVDGYLVRSGQWLFMIFEPAVASQMGFEGWLVKADNLAKGETVNLGQITELAYDENSTSLYYVDYQSTGFESAYKSLYKIDVSTDQPQKSLLNDKIGITYDRNSEVMVLVNGNQLWYASDYLYRIDLTSYTTEKIFNARINTPNKAFSSDRCRLIVQKNITDLNGDEDRPEQDVLTVINFGHLVPTIEKHIKLPSSVDTNIYKLRSFNLSPDSEFLVLVYYNRQSGWKNNYVIILDFLTEKILFSQELAPMLGVHYNYTGPTGPCPEVK